MRYHLLRYVVYPAYEAISGRRILSKWKELELSQWKSREEIAELQWDMLKRLLEHVYKHVPYYREAFDNRQLTPADIKDWEVFRRLPVLTKDVIQARKADLTSCAIVERDRIPYNTGGSTGQPLAFYLYRAGNDLTSAATLRSNHWADWNFGKKILCLWGHRRDVALAKSLSGKIRNFFMNEIFFDTFHFSQKDMEKLAAWMTQKSPNIIIAYASALYHFASYLKETGIQVPPLDSIVSSTDMLYDYQRTIIEGIFRCKVFNRYGCREVGVIAAECSEHRGMHINSDRLYVEFLDDKGNPVAPGKRGNIVITDLTNFAMPFIRYRIGDVGVPSDEICPCGRGLPLMAELTGREGDILTTPSGEYVSASALTTLLPLVKGLSQAQLVQKARDRLVVRVVKYEDYDESSEHGFKKSLQQFFGDDMQIDFEYVEQINKTASGKYRFSISEVPVKFTASVH